MSDQQEQGQTVPFDEKLLEMLKDAARVCNQQWPNSDSPASACYTVWVGVKNGLDERDAFKAKLRALADEHCNCDGAVDAPHTCSAHCVLRDLGIEGR